MRIISYLFLFVCLTQFVACNTDNVIDDLPIPHDSIPVVSGLDTTILVGVAYFAGWHSEDPATNKWIQYPWSDPVKKDFTLKGNPQWAGREPLLGKYNVQETMDKEIDAAAAYGVDFFNILWYYSNNAPPANRIAINRLNRGLEQYLASPNRNKMKFMMEACNADGHLSVTSEAGWDSITTVFVNAAKDTSYLRIEGRPVFKIHDASRFLTQLNNDVNRCRTVIQNIRVKAKNAGLGDVLIAIGTYGNGKIASGHKYTQFGVNCSMQYAGINESLPAFSQNPYEELGKYTKTIRDIRIDDALPWTPYIMSSWDASPWGGEKRPYFDFPTRSQWNKELSTIKAELLSTTKFGFPRKDGKLQKAFTIYAWNEFGEGGIVAPTVGEQYMKLEEIKNVFGVTPWYNK
jgi:hypothetical protein